MYTADNARSAAEMKHGELIDKIENAIAAAATELFESSTVFDFDRKVSKSVAENIAEIFRASPRSFTVTVHAISSDNYGPVDHYALSIYW
jgi:sugar-specific transcriptional regulator TrmB